MQGFEFHTNPLFFKLLGRRGDRHEPGFKLAAHASGPSTRQTNLEEAPASPGAVANFRRSDLDREVGVADPDFVGGSLDRITVGIAPWSNGLAFAPDFRFAVPRTRY